MSGWRLISGWLAFTKDGVAIGDGDVNRTS
jgi:hypothetical protein